MSGFTPPVGQAVDGQAATTGGHTEAVSDIDPTVGHSVDKHAATTVEQIDVVSDTDPTVDQVAEKQAAASVVGFERVRDIDPTHGHAVVASYWSFEGKRLLFDIPAAKPKIVSSFSHKARRAG